MTAKAVAPNTEIDDLWDFMVGYKKAMQPKNRPLRLDEPVEFFFSGKVPFVILVPEAEVDGETPQTFVIQDNFFIAQISFLKNVVKNNGGPLQMAVEDTTGELTYSTFYLRVISQFPLSKPLFGSIMDGDDYSSRKMHEIGANILRKFIKAYINAFHMESYKHEMPMKGKCFKDWIPVLDLRNISPLLDTKVFNIFGEVLYESKNTDYRGTGLGIGFNLGDDTLSILQSACIYDLLPSANTYISISNRLGMRREFEASCIMLTAALEKKIFELFRRKKQAEGWGQEQIDDWMYTDRLRKGSTTSYETKSVWKAARMICNGVSYAQEQSYIAVLEKLYVKRDEIIHGESILLSKEEAVEMNKAASDFLLFLESKL